MSLNLYPIVKQLGSGGFGKTYLAINTLMPSKPHCVVKQLIPVSNKPQLQALIQERFEKEGLVLESLGKNSNGKIPQLYAYFMEDGEFYLVQEYINGHNLRQRLTRDGVFKEEQIKKLLSEILPTLTFIHTQGIVHRDIKPDNIMLRANDNVPILIDFGAVKETMTTVASLSGNTGTSIVIGTPGFMPMEQMIGRPVFTSDIYALGLTMIYLLTGKMPSEIESDSYTGKVNWQKLVPNLSAHLTTVLDKAIQPVFKDRYQTAQEMLIALNAPNIQQPNSFPTTVVSAKPNDVNPNGNNIPLVAVVVGIVIGGGLLASGAMLWKNFASNDSVQNSQTEKNTPSVSVKDTIKPSTQPSQAIQTTSSTSSVTNSVNINKIGWLRIGAVASRDGQITIGQQLLSTSQPVTISPSVVPSIGAKIKVINSVNIRISTPQPPDYKLPEQTAALPPGQELVIINTHAFVDTTSSSPFTVVWAEVGIKQR
jgi:serine/threonine protein kinase, bacterial